MAPRATFLLLPFLLFANSALAIDTQARLSIESVTTGTKLQDGSLSELEVRGSINGFREIKSNLRPISFILGNAAETIYFKDVPPNAFREEGSLVHFSAPSDFWLRINRTDGTFIVRDTKPGRVDPLKLRRIVLRIGSDTACSEIVPATKLSIGYGARHDNTPRVFTTRGCSLIDRVQIDSPNGQHVDIIVGDKTTFRFSVRINTVTGLRPDSVELIRVDRHGQLVKGGLCTLRDNGSSTSGDAIAGDLLYSCKTELSSERPGDFFLTAQANLDGNTIRSESTLYLSAITPIEISRDLVGLTRIRRQLNYAA